MTTTVSPSSTTDYFHHVELRQGNNITTDEAAGNVFAMNRAGVLGPVCDDHWRTMDAGVVCRQLGYDFGIAYKDSHWGHVPADFAMDNVVCDGT